jgi:hypothetical protein
MRKLVFVVYIFWNIGCLWINIHAQNDTIIYYLEDDLPDIIISGQRTYTDGLIRLDRKHYLTLPASFDDPARLFQSYPSISTSNDQANSIIYRGLPSMFNTWSINGAEITNPNHLGNAGTRLDIGTLSSGGVNMISGQVLHATRFSLFPTRNFHTGLGANINMEIKSEEEDYTFAQLSLIGLEAGFNHNFKTSNSYVKGNARYSTTGLLADMGVSFDGEEIRFKDFMIGVGNSGKNYETNIVWAHGNSSNRKERLQDREKIESWKDQQRINFEARQDLFVFDSKYVMKNGIQWNLSLSLSYSKNDRESFGINEKTESYFDQEKASLHVTVEKSGLGIQHTRLFIKETLSSILNRFSSFFNYSFHFRNDNRYVNNWYGAFYDKRFDKLRVSLSGQFARPEIEDFIYNTNAKLTYFIPDTDLKIIGNYSRRNQFMGRLSAPYIDLEQDSIVQSNQVIAKQNTYELGFKWDKEHNLSMTLFYHDISDLPYSNENSYFLSEPIFLAPVGSWNYDGQRRSYGIELSSESNFSKDLFLHWNVSLFSSEIKRGKEGNWRSSFYDIGHNTNINISKVYRYSNERSLRLSASLKYSGGFNAPIIDPENSDSFFTTISTYEESNRLSDYIRADFRLVYQKKKSVLSLDIQNVLNRANEAYLFFDPLLNDVETQAHLGLIPVLSYRRYL